LLSKTDCFQPVSFGTPCNPQFRCRGVSIINFACVMTDSSLLKTRKRLQRASIQHLRCDLIASRLKDAHSGLQVGSRMSIRITNRLEDTHFGLRIANLIASGPQACNLGSQWAHFGSANGVPEPPIHLLRTCQILGF
jgi:hypothetical protein